MTFLYEVQHGHPSWVLAGTQIERYVVLGMQEGQASYSPIVVYIYNYIPVTGIYM